MLVQYSHNNSGGRWWLKDEDWHALEKEGWKVDWFKDNEFYTVDKNGRWLGALASRAEKEFLSPGDAMREFERITGQSVSDKGCNCCGAPHSFSWNDGYASDEDCLSYLFPDREIPRNLRDALENY